MSTKRKTIEKDTPSPTFIDCIQYIRTEKDNIDKKCCDHPLCKEVLIAYWKSGPNLCKNHDAEYHNGSDHMNIYATDADLDPSNFLCSRTQCTEYLRGKKRQEIAQFLFVCEQCKKDVCCFCTKECHKAGHTFSEVNYKASSCRRTEVVEVKEYYVVKEWETDGKCVRKTKVF